MYTPANPSFTIKVGFNGVKIIRGSCKKFCHWVRITSVLRFIKHIFIKSLQSIPPLLKHIFVTVLPSREKQINSLLLVYFGDTDKYIALPRELLDVYLFPESILLSLRNKKKSQGLRSGE